ncbi:MAG: YqgE/AlgH family protein [Deltaproteobacteria bacterium]|nr:MAG: YqgE/AlgH family protein [Deltaproteobacteria bacterium]
MAKVITATLILLAILPRISLIGPTSSGKLTKLLTFQFPINLPSPGYVRSQAGAGKGKFLIASQHLRDPNFSESVVLLTDYGRYGAMGLVINQPTDVRLSTLFPDIKGVQQSTDTLYIGGPVARNRLLLLIRSDTEPEGSHRVFEDIYVSSNRTVFQRMIEEGKGKLRVYTGHAGWAPGQLEGEISRGDWHILPADRETIFDKAPSEIWPELIRRSSGSWVRMQMPGGNMNFSILLSTHFTPNLTPASTVW